MATVTKGYTFTDGGQITAASLHALVESATVTGIKSADISDAQITPAKLSIGAGLFRTSVATTSTKVLNYSGADADWTDLDLTASTSATATSVVVAMNVKVASGIGRLSIRKNGSSDSAGVRAVNSIVTGASGYSGTIECELDAGQILEYKLETIFGSGTVTAEIWLLYYRETF